MPCAEGVFTELKLPTVYTDVELFDDASDNLLGDGTIDSNDSVSVDLTP